MHVYVYIETEKKNVAELLASDSIQKAQPCKLFGAPARRSRIDPWKLRLFGGVVPPVAAAGVGVQPDALEPGLWDDQQEFIHFG